MKHKESSTSNPRPNRVPNRVEDNDRKNVFHNRAEVQLQLLEKVMLPVGAEALAAGDRKARNYP